jgi:hypothetical protein
VALTSFTGIPPAPRLPQPTPAVPVCAGT